MNIEQKNKWLDLIAASGAGWAETYTAHAILAALELVIMGEAEGLTGRQALENALNRIVNNHQV
ncbi:hypothetical protein F3Z56_22055 [Salmonella enterica]|nr:hypothetical protein [Salmonella enterica]